MSRNIGTTRCSICDYPRLLRLETPRLYDKDYFRHYYEHYKHGLFSRGLCPVCGTHYLLWHSLYSPEDAPFDSQECGYQDTSFYYAFNDEPASSDVPYAGQEALLKAKAFMVQAFDALLERKPA